VSIGMAVKAKVVRENDQALVVFFAGGIDHE
jgi:hypothetical protein